MVFERIKFLASDVAPKPEETTYWVDIWSNPYGGVIKYYNGEDWVKLDLISVAEDYNRLRNKPSLNGVIIEGDKTSEDYNIPTPESVNEVLDEFREEIASIDDKVVKVSDKLNNYIESNNIDIEELKTDISDIQSSLDLILGNSASEVIDKFNEILSFLEGFEDTDKLKTIFALLELKFTELINNVEDDLDLCKKELLAKINQVQSNLDAHKDDYNNPHNVTKVLVGLGNVDNTADMDKPISTLTLLALDYEATIRDEMDTELAERVNNLTTVILHNTKYNTTLSEQLVTPTKLGGIKQGTTVKDLKGDSFILLFDDLLFEEVQPNVSNPYGTISPKGNWKANGIYEVGAAAPSAESDFNYSFNRGSSIVIGLSNRFRAGTETGHQIKLGSNLIAANTKISLNEMIYSIVINYGEGDELVTSHGKKANITPNPLPAGSVTARTSIFGTYPYFCNGQTASSSNLDNDLPSVVTPDTKLPLLKWSDVLIGTKFASEASTGTRLEFQFPSDKNVTKVEFFNTASGKWEVFTSNNYSISSLGNKQIQGINVAYKKLTTIGALSGALQLRFTISNVSRTDVQQTYNGEPITDEVFAMLAKNSNTIPFLSEYSLNVLSTGNRPAGISNFAVNFEPGGQTPLDARSLVPYKSDLIHSSTYSAKNYYKGMMVVVINDDGKPGIYILNDVNKITASDYSGWTKLDANAIKIVEVVNNLTSGGTDKALSAEQGKYLKSLVDSLNNTTIKTSEKGAANGIATLNENAMIPSSQLPSYVDDVIDCFATFTKNTDGSLTNIHLYEDESHQREIRGESGKIYIDITVRTLYNDVSADNTNTPSEVIDKVLDEYQEHYNAQLFANTTKEVREQTVFGNYQFRWTGTQFAVINASTVIGEITGTAFDGGRGKLLENLVNKINGSNTADGSFRKADADLLKTINSELTTIRNSINTVKTDYVKKVGDSMTGSLTVPSLTASGNILAAQFKKTGSSSSYVLLGDGNHKPVSDFATATHSHNNLVILLNGGTTEGTDKFTYNTTSSKTVNITADSIGVTTGYFSLKKLTNIDLRSLDKTKFYPVITEDSANLTECVIISVGGNASLDYNYNTIHFTLIASGYYDSGNFINVHELYTYDSNEITIGSIGHGLESPAACVWLRGGITYNFYSNHQWNLKTSDYTPSSSSSAVLFTVGTTFSGGTNKKVGILFDRNKFNKEGSIRTLTLFLNNNIYVNGDISLENNAGGSICFKSKPIFRINDKGNVVISSENSDIYIRPCGSSISSNQIKVKTDGTLEVAGNIYNTESEFTIGTINESNICLSYGNGLKQVYLTSVDFRPAVASNGKIDLGSNEAKWKNLYLSGNAKAALGFYEESDERLKTNIKPIEQKGNIELVEFDWKETGKHSYGVIAQQIEESYPELIDNTGDYKTVKYDSVLIVKCAQLELRINKLEKELEEFKNGKNCNRS